MSDPRRHLPSVEEVVSAAAFDDLLARYPRARVVGALRRALDAVRVDPRAAEGGVEGAEAWAARVGALLAREDVPSLRPALNATGVVLHTNLGRAPLAEVAERAMSVAATGYSNLEYDLEEGARGSRYVHCAGLVRELTGAEDALVVNNCAAALLLALNTLARGRGVAVSRGELVEIGGGFRVPEVLERSGARLVEVGSTNRTRIADYRTALDGGDVAALLKVHRSNFRITGFTEEAALGEVAELARGAGVPLLYDLGSGLLADPAALGLPAEPRIGEALAAGADLVAISCDKLLGGPQAGVVAGSADLVAGLRSNPLCRALRVDKVTLAGLEATLALYRDPERALSEIPVLRMLRTPLAELERRSRELAARLRDAGVPGAEAEPAQGAVGGGTCPDVALRSWAVRLPAPAGADRLAASLRDGEPPVVGRIREGALLLDVRTVPPERDGDLLRRAREAATAAGTR